MAYTTNAKIADYLQRSLTTDETDFLAVVIPAIKIWLDKKLGSTFDEASETTRYFDAAGMQSLDIDPCTAITAVKSVDDERGVEYAYTNLTEYIAEPQNETVKRELVRRGSGRWPRGLGSVAVTAKFSEYDNGVPEDIQVIATRIAAEILNTGKRESAGGNVSSESLEGHSIHYDTSSDVLETIADNDPIIKSMLALRTEPLVG